MNEKFFLERAGLIGVKLLMQEISLLVLGIQQSALQKKD